MAANNDPVALSAGVAALAQSFQLTDGKVSLPKDAFLKWKAEHAKLAPVEKTRCCTELVALAVRFQREGGASAAEGIGQLYVLAANLVGEAEASAGFKAAGVGWGPKGKAPGGGGGWGSKR